MYCGCQGLDQHVTASAQIRRVDDLVASAHFGFIEAGICILDQQMRVIVETWIDGRCANAGRDDLMWAVIMGNTQGADGAQDLLRNGAGPLAVGFG